MPDDVGHQATSRKDWAPIVIMPKRPAPVELQTRTAHRISPIQNDGVANTSMATAVMALSARVPARIAASAPRPTPINQRQQHRGAGQQQRPCGSRSAISRTTGTPLAIGIAETPSATCPAYKRQLFPQRLVEPEFVPQVIEIFLGRPRRLPRP